MGLRRTLSGLGATFVVGVPVLVAAGGRQAVAAPVPGSDHVIVSMNVVTPDGEPHEDPRPQSFEAALDGMPSTRGVGVTWAGGRFQVSVGSGSDEPLHAGLSGTPQLGQRNPDTHLYGQAMLDEKSYLNFDGQVDVLDLAADASGRLTRFDIVFSYTEQRAVGAVFGEMRMNEPEQAAALAPTAQHLVWPRVGFEDAPVLATDSFRNTSGAPLPVGAARVEGASRDFVVRADACSDRVLPVDGSCSITVAYRPTNGGPRLASLVVPTPIDQSEVDLSSAAPLGRSVLTTTGKEYVDRGKSTTFSPIVVYSHGDYGDPRGSDHLYRFVPDERSPGILASPGAEFSLDLSKKHGDVRRGTHKTERFDREYGFDYHANTQYCEDLHGTVDVRHLVLDPDGQPTYVDVDFAQRCSRAHTYPTGTIHGKLRYQERKDTTAPRKPTRLRIDDGRVRWTKSTSKDLASTIVRVDLGNRFAPTRGRLATLRSSQTADLPQLQTDQTYTVAAFSVDKTGNVSRPTTIKIKT